MKRFFKILLSSSNEVSSRRVIAIIMLVPFFIGVLGGVWVGLKYQNFQFFALSLGLAALIICLTYYALTWEHAKDFSNSRIFKRENSFYDNQTIDP